MIYKGTRVAKLRDWDIDIDSPMWIKDIDLPTVQTEVRFPLSEVVYWGEYAGEIDDEGKMFNPIKNNKIIEVILRDKGQILIITPLEVFDSHMESYYSNRMLFRQQ